MNRKRLFSFSTTILKCILTEQCSKVRVQRNTLWKNRMKKICKLRLFVCANTTRLRPRNIVLFYRKQLRHCLYVHGNIPFPPCDVHSRRRENEMLRSMNVCLASCSFLLPPIAMKKAAIRRESHDASSPRHTHRALKDEKEKNCCTAHTHGFRKAHTRSTFAGDKGKINVQSGDGSCEHIPRR